MLGGHLHGLNAAVSVFNLLHRPAAERTSPHLPEMPACFLLEGCYLHVFLGPAAGARASAQGCQRAMHIPCRTVFPELHTLRPSHQASPSSIMDLMVPCLHIDTVRCT